MADSATTAGHCMGTHVLQMLAGVCLLVGGVGTGQSCTGVLMPATVHPVCIDNTCSTM
jgi:hypothetical protein